MAADPEKAVLSVVRDYLPLFSKVARSPPRDKLLMRDLRLTPDDFYEVIEEISGGLEMPPRADLAPPDLTIAQIIMHARTGAWPAEYVFYPPPRNDRLPRWRRWLEARLFGSGTGPESTGATGAGEVAFRGAVIVNENRDLEEPGSVLLFRSVSDACAYLEPIDVDAGAYRAVTASGLCLDIFNVSWSVRMAESASAPPDQAYARRLLEHALRSLHGVGKAQAVSIDDTTERLIGAIGFER